MKKKVIAILAILAVCASSYSIKDNIKRETKEEEPIEDPYQFEQVAILDEDFDISEFVVPSLEETKPQEQTAINEEENFESEEQIEDELILEEQMLKLVGLTFDDGPGPYTKELVDLLESYGYSATFFVVGSRLNSYEEELKTVSSSNSEIGIHTYSHEQFTKLGLDKTLEEVNKTKSILDELDINYTNVVRPPYGSINQTIKDGVDFPMILWNVDTLDWKTRNKDSVCEEILKGIEEGNIILLHDIHPSTIEGVKLALQQIPEGYKLVSISKLAESNNYDLENGHCYYSLKLK